MNEINRSRGGGNRSTERGTDSRRGTTGTARTRKTAPSGRSSEERIQAVKNARSHAGGASSDRHSTTNYKRRKKKRQGPDLAKLLLIGIGVLILILCIAVGLRGCAKNSEAESTTETIEPETEVNAEITVNGVSVNGLTKSEAKAKVLEAIGWDVRIVYDGEEKELPNMMESKVEMVLTEAFEKGEAGTYTADAKGLEDHVKTQVDIIAADWDKEPRNGSISSYNKETNEFIFAGAESGVMIKREKLVEDIMKRLTAEDYQTAIEAEAEIVQPEVSEEEAKANFKRIGTFTTTTTSNKDRNENIRIASSALNGIILQPGEEFSFNQTTGNRTTDKGYRPAGAYQNGVLVEEPGGGVCQVSSTLYNAVVFAGLKTTERHAHSYEPSYVTPGEDAMVSYDGHSGPDMKFVNNSKTAVGIKTSFSDRKLIISIYGNPILEEGVTLSMSSKKTKELDPPKPEYEEDPYMELDLEEEVKAATPGSVWVTNLITKKDGAVVSEVLLHTSVYNGKPATVKRNTSGTVLTSEGETSEGESSESESPSESSIAPTVAPTETSPTYNYQGPGFEPDETTSPGPGDVTEPTLPTAPENLHGPAGQQNQNLGGPGGPAGGNPTPETSVGPGDVGQITPNL